MDQVIAVFTAFLTAALPLSVGVTKFTDLCRNLFDSSGAAPRFVWNVVPFVGGVGLCVGWQFNLVGALAHSIPALVTSSSLDGVAGQVLTGLAVGGMAGLWHNKLEQWASAAKLSTAKTASA